MRDNIHTSNKRQIVLNFNASLTTLRILFCAWSLLTVLGCYYGLTSHLFALCPSLLSFGFLTLVWPNGQAELFSATPSISVKRRTIFAELCAITYIFCAALSLLFRLYSGKFNYGGSLLHLQKQTITVICKLDLASSLAIIIAHVTGHHDICDRIHRRLLRLGRALRITCWSLYLVLYATLQELPRELESQHSLEHVSLIDVENPVDSAFLPAPLIPSPAAMGLTTSEHQNQRGNDICKVDVLDRANERRKFPLMRQLSSDPYTAVHQGFRSIRAQVRWSSLRYRLQFQRQPLPEFLVMIASQIRSNRLEVELRYSNAVPPPVQILPFRSGPFTDHPPLFAALVMNILPQQPGTRHNEQRWRPLPFGGQIPTSSTRRNAALMTPIFQLPGTIQNISVKALPDTGSSQNVIDLSLVDNLFPAVTIQPFDPTDKPLVAPDGELIPCVGKALLPWMFKLGNKVYKKWFYIVNGCSHGVIIGNGFLDETETMNKHQERLEITEPVEPEPIVGKLVSEAQQDDCLRQIVLGTINGEKAAASLDTGCQANLMSASYAQQLNLEIYPPTVGCQLVEFANGRKGPTLGQVEFSWTFADKPDEEIFVKCHVLSKCIHSVIFGDRFIHSEKPWERHEKSLSQIRTNTADLLAVGLHRSFWPFKKAKPDAQEEAERRKNKERNDRWTASLQLLQQGQRQLPQQPPGPALPPAAVLPASTPPNQSSTLSSSVLRSQGPTAGPSLPHNDTIASNTLIASDSLAALTSTARQAPGSGIIPSSPASQDSAGGTPTCLPRSSTP